MLCKISNSYSYRGGNSKAPNGTSLVKMVDVAG